MWVAFITPKALSARLGLRLRRWWRWWSRARTGGGGGAAVYLFRVLDLALDGDPEAACNRGRSVPFIEDLELVLSCVMPFHPVDLPSCPTSQSILGDSKFINRGLEGAKLAVGVQLIRDGTRGGGRGLGDELQLDHDDLIFMVGLEYSRAECWAL